MVSQRRVACLSQMQFDVLSWHPRCTMRRRQERLKCDTNGSHADDELRRWSFGAERVCLQSRDRLDASRWSRVHACPEKWQR